MKVQCTRFFFLFLLCSPAYAGSELHGWDKLKSQPEVVKKLAATVATHEMGSRGWDALRDKSVEQVKALAAKGDAAAEASFAERMLRGIGMPADINGAIALFGKSAAQKFAPAYMRLGDLYSSGDVVDQDQEKARRDYEQAMALGYAPAEYQLGMMYFCDKSMGGLGDAEKGIKLCKHAAEGGSIKAALFLGKLYATGTRSMKPDITEAYRWYLLGAHLGADDCAEAVAKAYYKGAGGFKQDTKQAIIYYSMHKNTPEAKKWYKRFSSGEKLSAADEKAANEWFMKARLYHVKDAEEGWSVLHRD